MKEREIARKMESKSERNEGKEREWERRTEREKGRWRGKEIRRSI